MSISGSGAFHMCMIKECEAMSRTQPDLKESRYLGQERVCCLGEVAVDHMYVDSIISHSLAGPSVGAESSLLSRMQ